MLGGLSEGRKSRAFALAKYIWEGGPSVSFAVLHQCS